MGNKVTIVTNPGIRASINNQNRTAVRTVVTPADSGGVTDLTALNDVDASDADDNEVLVYDGVQEKFVVKPIPSVDGGTF